MDHPLAANPSAFVPLGPSRRPRIPIGGLNGVGIGVGIVFTRSDFEDEVTGVRRSILEKDPDYEITDRAGVYFACLEEMDGETGTRKITFYIGSGDPVVKRMGQQVAGLSPAKGESDDSGGEGFRWSHIIAFVSNDLFIDKTLSLYIEARLIQRFATDCSRFIRESLKVPFQLRVPGLFMMLQNGTGTYPGAASQRVTMDSRLEAADYFVGGIFAIMATAYGNAHAVLDAQFPASSRNVRKDEPDPERNEWVANPTPVSIDPADTELLEKLAYLEPFLAPPTPEAEPSGTALLKASGRPRTPIGTLNGVNITFPREDFVWGGLDFRLKDGSNDPDYQPTDKAGVYFARLEKWGEGPSGVHEVTFYIGSGDPVVERIGQQVQGLGKNDKKDRLLWTHVTVFVSNDLYIDKTLSLYIEARLIERFQADAKRFNEDASAHPGMRLTIHNARGGHYVTMDSRRELADQFVNAIYAEMARVYDSPRPDKSVCPALSAEPPEELPEDQRRFATTSMPGSNPVAEVTIDLRCFLPEE